MGYKQTGTEYGRGAAIVNAAALTAAAAAGATPTKAEHDALVADVVAVHAKLNDLLNNLRDTNLVD